MINAVICTHKAGDVIGLTLQQLIDAPCVTRILIADGPHTGAKQFGTLVDKPSVKAVVDGLASDKVVYQHSDHHERTAQKTNAVLAHVSADCAWLLCVDSDEVYHEDALTRLAEWLPAAEYGRYAIKTVDPYPDFYHWFQMPDWKPRLYQWFPGTHCGGGWESHQWPLHARQKRCPGGMWGAGRVPVDVCEVYHLNAVRPGNGRVQRGANGTVSWSGGGNVWHSQIEVLQHSRIPASVLHLGRATL